MSAAQKIPTDSVLLERNYPATMPEQVWQLWTTAAGIEQWWAPEGFTVRVAELDLQPGGTLRYAMTATAPEQVAFMESHGMPLTTESTKRFTELDAPHRIAYRSLVDFVPGIEPYEVVTIVEIEATANGGTHVAMHAEPMHDATWNERLLAGRSMELDALGRILAG
ncbi:MAG: SRPBCC domain-containing protein [Solirubrobacteraceae bacterium]|nr:SRPBCC domain-containing protein [Solirubrobacteraceae bacterium]